MSARTRLWSINKHAKLLVIGSAFIGTAAHAALITLPQSALNSSPGVYTAGGYYTTNLGNNIVTTGGGNASNVGQADGRNDDGFMELSLGFDFTLYGSTYNSLFINNNGNVSFGSGISSYIPEGPTGASAPVVSVYFSDVDTRDPTSGVVQYNLMTDQLIVTWDNVGRYNSQPVPPENSFQLVLRSDSYSLPVGEGQIGFFYQNMGWELTNTSTTAAVGFGDGSGNATVIAGSNTPGMNAVVNERYIWFNANLTPVPPEPPVGGVPSPSTLSLLSLGLIGAGAISRRKRRIRLVL